MTPIDMWLPYFPVDSSDIIFVYASLYISLHLYESI